MAALLILTACGQSPDEFRRTDPEGFLACLEYAQVRGAGGDVFDGGTHRAAEHATRSTTAEIRAAIDDGTGYRSGIPVIADLGAFESACKAAGFRF